MTNSVTDFNKAAALVRYNREVALLAFNIKNKRHAAFIADGKKKIAFLVAAYPEFAK